MTLPQGEIVLDPSKLPLMTHNPLQILIVGKETLLLAKRVKSD